MQVTHPQEPYLNIPPEDVYIALNEQNVQCGYGYVMYQYAPLVYPDRPVNIFFSMDCTPEAEYMLFGALVARARQMRQSNPNEGARVYTSVQPGDTRKLNFCLHNGLVVGNTEDVVRLQMPLDGGPDMFNCNFGRISLNTVQEQQQLLSRLHASGLTHFTQDYLQRLQANPVFVALSISYGPNLAGECLISGRGDGTAELAAIYINPAHQRRGLGKRLLQRALAICAVDNVGEVHARIMSASQPQVRLMRAFGMEVMDQTLLFPCKDL